MSRAAGLAVAFAIVLAYAVRDANLEGSAPRATAVDKEASPVQMVHPAELRFAFCSS